MADLDEWLKLAPKPAERAAGQKWHVFLSYRSVERAWVLSLYDTLTQLGYETFLDQFVLDTASRLPRALEENLDASQAGIMIWSPRSEDSEWCKREYDGFVTKETGAFRFVIARLGSVELPLWARSKLWVDFGDDREGPRGTGLLRLLYGLQGRPLPDEAVRLAVDIDEETRRSLARIRVATEAAAALRVRGRTRVDRRPFRSARAARSDHSRFPEVVAAATIARTCARSIATLARGERCTGRALRARRARSRNDGHLRSHVDGLIRGDRQHAAPSPLARPLRGSVQRIAVVVLRGHQRGLEEHFPARAGRRRGVREACAGDRRRRCEAERLLDDGHGGRGAADPTPFCRRRAPLWRRRRDGAGPYRRSSIQPEAGQSAAGTSCGDSRRGCTGAKGVCASCARAGRATEAVTR